MNLLALDLATKTGFAHGEPGGMPTWGSHKLPQTGEDYGAFGLAYEAFLSALIQSKGVTRIVYESPILPSTTTLATARKLYSLGTITEMIAGRLGVKCHEAHMQTVRGHFIGASRAPKHIPQKDRRSWMKSRIIGQCIARGWNVTNDDEADALAVFDWASAIINQKHAANTAGPLLTGAMA